MNTGGQEAKGLEVPRLVCALAILLGAAALGVQATIDIYQNVNPKMDWPTWLTQAWQMALPTGFTLIFAAFAGGAIKASRKRFAFGLYVLVCGYLAYTASNSMDFLANQTVAHTQAQIVRQSDVKAIIDIQNETVRQERKEKTETLWRTYTTAKNQADKDKVLLKIQEATQEPIALQSAEVQVVQTGSGGILNRWLGWRPESVQETKALAFPILVMIGKALAITLGIAYWPPSTAAAERWRSQLPKERNLPGFPETERKLTKLQARDDLVRMAEAGSNVESGRELADRWGVTESCASKWLRDFRKEGIIRRERRGKFMAVQAVPHINGNGKAYAS